MSNYFLILSIWFVAIHTLPYICYSNEIIREEKISFNEKLILKEKSDTVLNLNYKQLYDRFQNCRKDSICKRKFASAYLKKAKSDNLKIEIAEGYLLKSYLEKWDRLEAIKYTDSAINITQKLEHKDFPAKAYLLKANYLLFIKNYEEAMNFYLIAKEFAENNQNFYQNLRIRHSIANLKTSISESEEAIHLYKENLKTMDSLGWINKHPTLYKYSLLGIGDGYNRIWKPKEGLPFIEKGLKLSHQKDIDKFIASFRLCYGINRYFAQDYLLAKDTLLTAVSYYTNFTNSGNRSVSRLYLAKSYLKLGKKDSAMFHLQAIDRFINKDNYFADIRDAYEILQEVYKEKNDLKNELRILNKLILFDSISYSKTIKVNNRIFKQFEKPDLLKRQQELENKIKIKDHNNSSLKVFVIILFLTLLAVITAYVKRQRRNEEKFKKLLEERSNLNTHKKNINEVEDKVVTLSDEVSIDIIAKIDKFEKNEGYLDCELTLAKMAKNLNTNSTYLSRIINNTKQQNFSTYLNDLRVDFAIERLKNDEKYRKYSLKYVAKEAGFSSERSFSRAFLKKTGINPSLFVKKINRL